MQYSNTLTATGSVMHCQWEGTDFYRRLSFTQKNYGAGIVMVLDRSKLDCVSLTITFSLAHHL